MSRTANIQIDSWGDKFLISGYFNGVQLVVPIEYDTYANALKAMQKYLGREIIKYESGLGDYSSR